MANSSGRRASSSGSKQSGSKQQSFGRKKSNAPTYDYQKESELLHEIGLIIFFILMVILFLCNFGIIGPVGNVISEILFGIFGLTAYVVPVMLFIAVSFWYANSGNPNALRKLIAGIVFFVMIGVVCELFAGDSLSLEKYELKQIYETAKSSKRGGGVIAGSLAYLLHHYLETIGTALVVLLCGAISFILMTERSLISGVKNGGSRMLERTREDSERRREYARQRREEQAIRRAQQREAYRSRREEQEETEEIPREDERRRRTRERESERQQRREEKDTEKILRMDKKVSGVILDTAIARENEERRRDDIHEIMWNEGMEEAIPEETAEEEEGTEEYVSTLEPVSAPSVSPLRSSEVPAAAVPVEQEIRIHREDLQEPPQQINKDIQNTEAMAPRKYIFPPLSRLQKGVARSGGSTRELKETAMRLQQTLNTFGVKVTITDISQGPSVTRYELQPEQGVKVSKIVGLSDDIKLNLAATDIRIEAPIPGKAAIGIEVPNKENMPVALRDLLESKEFKEFPSNLAFAVGKDIGGQTVVADIAKMPHMLIAGATGSGKSVCINTLIMSILYKAHPDDVKLIMVDPKVVELSVYNGIPHLLIPVVTDPKKASAALHWGVSEMTERYKKFADFNVRDLKGYNKKVEAMRESGDPQAPARMPQIVIIVDELADLMMVAPGEVEESICRLAQLARAAGIHLIIATQRPSVDVITGLIKANMPSRVAFSVSSGVDSRTILDMNGAEKLLGKGDMLFYPQGYSKPARIQGAFVSDKEVSDVVDFLKNQALGNTYASDIEEQLKNMGSSGGAASGGDEKDEYFEEAGRFIIDKDKASIGMLQRAFKIGFNRAARIMEQLHDYGVVGEEEGTKPRKILMSMEEFEQLLEEI